MPIVTIRGQYGSLAPEIGIMVAQGIHGDYVDRPIIARVANQLNRHSVEVEAKEAPSASLLQRILEALGRGGLYGTGIEGVYMPVAEIPLEDTRYLEALTAVIKQLATSPSIVIRGRGSQFILKDNERAFHVFIVAPLEMRVKNVMTSLKVGEETARKEIERVDSSGRLFIKKYFQADLEEPIHYDIVINTKHLSIQTATDIIVNTAISLD